jgi:hypothetical protein
MMTWPTDPAMAERNLLAMINTEPSGYYFIKGEIYIISDFPGAEIRMKDHPELPVKTLAELEKLIIDDDAR